MLIHGFIAQQQLGFTMDGVPLGDQQYGNQQRPFSSSRAVTSENVGHVTLSSGAGELGIASTSNLGGAIETFSSDPSQDFGVDLRQTLGSFYTTRTFIRVDTGDMGVRNTAYIFISGLYHDAARLDFVGIRCDDQANLKFVHEDEHGQAGRSSPTMTTRSSQTKTPPASCNQQTAAAAGFTPYTRLFLYPEPRRRYRA